MSKPIRLRPHNRWSALSFCVSRCRCCHNFKLNFSKYYLGQIIILIDDSKMRMEWFTCRVQFVNDTDPLTYSNTSFPEPTRPPFHCFNANIPLVNQLPAVHRLLGAPHQVNFCFYHFLDLCFKKCLRFHFLSFENKFVVPSIPQKVSTDNIESLFQIRPVLCSC